jgi:hypothetical protein
MDLAHHRRSEVTGLSKNRHLISCDVEFRTASDCAFDSAKEGKPQPTGPFDAIATPDTDQVWVRSILL